MAKKKRKRPATKRTVKGKPAEVRVPGPRKKTAKKAAARTAAGRKQHARQSLSPWKQRQEPSSPRDDSRAWWPGSSSTWASKPERRTQIPSRQRRRTYRNSWTTSRRQQAQIILTSGQSPSLRGFCGCCTRSRSWLLPPSTGFSPRSNT